MTQNRKLQKSFEFLNPTEDNPATGYLGTLLNGAYTIPNIRYPAQFYVRFPDHRFVSALHKGRVRAIGTFDASIEVELFINSRGQWEIKGTAPLQSDAIQQAYGSEIYLIDHSHVAADIADFDSAADTRIGLAVLDDLDDVLVPTPTDGDVLTWVVADEQWENKPPTGGFANPMTTEGDIIFQNGSGDPDRLPIGTAGQVLGSDGMVPVWVTPTGGGGGGGSSAVIQLDYVAVADIMSGVSVSAGAWTDFDSVQNFTVDTSNDVMMIAVRGGAFARSGGTEVASRILIDGTDAYMLGAAPDGDTGFSNNNPFMGAGPISVNNLLSGSHTLQVQVLTRGSSALFYCRPALVPETEFFAIQVIELGGAGGGGGTAIPYLLIEEEQVAGTYGGTFTAGAWRTRILNTIVEDDTAALVLASNQFTPPAGTYRIEASAPAVSIDMHRIRLYNVTDSIQVRLGTSEYNNSDTAQTRSALKGRFTTDGTKAFEIQHQCATTRATQGFGVPGSLDTEIYTIVELWKEG